MKKKIVVGIVFFLFFIYGCSSKCETEAYTKDGKCCTYVCDKICGNGFSEGTCNCECAGTSANTPTNIESIFDDNENIEPPQIPN